MYLGYFYFLVFSHYSNPDGRNDYTVLRMGKVREKRAEKRLRYRWHTRFTSKLKQKPLSAQMIDLSSKGMSILCRADKDCPKPDQFITTNFGVPYFDSDDSFDTVFFNRIGRVCRVENLTSKVSRIAVKFVEPLFFKPGEQNVSESDAKQRLEAKAQLIAGEKEKEGIKTQIKTKADDQVKRHVEEHTSPYSETLARADERIRSYAKAKAEAEEKLKVEIEARHKREAKLLAEAQEKIRIYAEAKARAEEKAKAEAKARAKAEAKAKAEARLRAKAEKKAQNEAEKRAKIEAELQQKIEFYAEELAIIKAQATQEIVNFKTESEPNEKEPLPEKNTRDKAKKSGQGILMDKVDKFITDRSRIF